MSAVREAVGPDIQMTSTHTPPRHCSRGTMCKDLEQFKPFFIEDPIRSENHGSYRNLRRQVKFTDRCR
ncbi:MAG: hypothetical protein Ct9H300mP19_19410 [Dehalococcoidia bacterium]|nr:MAG: hypothetical protein Ct9H300mP19_19410 [Dehalococcoidia bacterium]